MIMNYKRNKNILVVGGAGYIGAHVNKMLHERGYSTVVFDNLINGHREFVKWGEFVLGDLKNIGQIRLCFEKYNIDAVMHLSAFAYVGESVIDPAKYYLNNVSYTLNLLEVMREYKVDKIIFSSTCAIYGMSIQIPMTETHPQSPINPYGRTKLIIEQILSDYNKAYGIKYVNLRYFNAAGADSRAEIGEWHNPETHLIPLVLDVALGRRSEVKIFGTDYHTNDGTCIRDYIHVEDLADAHILALEYLLAGNESDSMNLGIGRGYSVLEVIRTAEKITGKKIKAVEWQRREGDPPILVSSNEKIKKILNWRPKYIELEDIIKTAWVWHQKL